MKNTNKVDLTPYYTTIKTDFRYLKNTLKLILETPRLLSIKHKTVFIKQLFLGQTMDHTILELKKGIG